MKTPKITLYSATKCSHCKQAKTYLKQKGVAFMELNVQTNVRAAKALQKLGSRGVPVILIGDQRIDGFNKSKLDKLLKPYGK